MKIVKAKNPDAPASLKITKYEKDGLDLVNCSNKHEILSNIRRNKSLVSLYNKLFNGEFKILYTVETNDVFQVVQDSVENDSSIFSMKRSFTASEIFSFLGENGELFTFTLRSDLDKHDFLTKEYLINQIIENQTPSSKVALNRIICLICEHEIKVVKRDVNYFKKLVLGETDKTKHQNACQLYEESLARFNFLEEMIERHKND